jgi:hypothetical protein
MTTAILLAIGLVLCLAGAWSLRLAVLTSGFGAAWLLANVFGASFVTGLLVALAGAAVAFVITVTLAKIVMFVSGCIVGAVVGAKLFVVLSGSDTSWLLALVFVPAAALLSGFLAGRFQRRFLQWGTAFAGAALVLSGLAAIGSDDLGLFRRPETGTQTLLLTISWLALGIVGHSVQQRLPRHGRRRED